MPLRDRDGLAATLDRLHNSDDSSSENDEQATLGTGEEQLHPNILSLKGRGPGEGLENQEVVFPAFLRSLWIRIPRMAKHLSNQDASISGDKNSESLGAWYRGAIGDGCFGHFGIRFLNLFSHFILTQCTPGEKRA